MTDSLQFEIQLEISLIPNQVNLFKAQLEISLTSDQVDLFKEFLEELSKSGSRIKARLTRLERRRGIKTPLRDQK